MDQRPIITALADHVVDALKKEIEALKGQIKHYQEMLVRMDEELEKAAGRPSFSGPNVGYIPMDGKLTPIMIRSWKVSRSMEPIYILGRPNVVDMTYPGAVTIEVEGTLIRPYTAVQRHLDETIRVSNNLIRRRDDEGNEE